MLDLVNHLRELIHALARVIVLARPVFGAEMAPLEAIDGSQVSLAPM